MQRVYGITFPDKELMADYKHRMEEAKKRDHRTQGTKQELFFFDKLSPGSCFFLPNGARIYNTLIEVSKTPIRDTYARSMESGVASTTLFTVQSSKNTM